LGSAFQRKRWAVGEGQDLAPNLFDQDRSQNLPLPSLRATFSPKGGGEGKGRRWACHIENCCLK